MGRACVKPGTVMCEMRDVMHESQIKEVQKIAKACVNHV